MNITKNPILLKNRKENILEYYEFDPKPLGKGGCGIVYKGKLKEGSKQHRAIKKICRKNVKNPQLLTNEIQIMKSLNHPTCVKLYEVFQDQVNVFLVMDLCQGGQLFEKLDRNGQFSQVDAKIIFMQMVEAISYCHHHKICHRDLKPENFMFVSKSSLELKLIDFGLAFHWNSHMRTQIFNKENKEKKKLVGTSYYMAPQIIKGNYDQRCDIWSLGVILYILLTAVPPFGGDNDKEILLNVKKMEYTMNIPEMKPVSKTVQELIQKILVQDNIRIKVQEIFDHPWMVNNAKKVKLNLNFNKIKNYTKFSKLKKITANYLASQVSPKQVQKLGQIFRKIDLNHDGELSVEQLKIALKQQKNIKILSELSSIMQSLYESNSGKLNYNEFLASFTENQIIFSEERIKQMFKKIDKDGNGFVDKEQLIELFKNQGLTQFQGKNIDEIMKECDKDGNGVIDYAQFRQHLLA